MLKELPHSIQIEKRAIGGLLNHPDVLPIVDVFMADNCFYDNTHETIFSVMRKIFNSGQRIDKIFVAQRIKDLGVKLQEGIDIFEYLEALTFSQITDKATIKACQELVSLRIKRELIESAQAEIDYVHNAKDQTVDKIVSGVDAIHNSNINKFTLTEQPKNLFENIEQEIEDIGANPVEENGFKTPFPEFNRLYGGLIPGEIYSVVARPGQSKSTFISYLCFECSKISNFNIKVLILDTEMESKLVKHRMAAALSGVPLWYVQTGNWRKNPEMTEKMRRILPEMNKYKMDHLHVANKSVDEVCSIVRRWYYNEVGRGNKAIVAYDYIKLTGEKLDKNWAEHQALGEKINRLKEICVEIGVPLVTAMQMNRSGENHNKHSKDVTDDSSAIAQTDRLQWFASFVAIFRRKTLDEIATDGIERGTHALIPLKARTQGIGAMGHLDAIRRTFADGSSRYMNNYINYSVENFKITEKGSLRDIVEEAKLKIQLDNKDKKDEDDATL